MQRRVKLKNRKFTRAFSRVRAGGSLYPGVSYGEARARAEALAFVSQPFTGETSKEPRLSILESRIHELAKAGDHQGVRNLLFEYLRLSGVSC